MLHCLDLQAFKYFTAERFATSLTVPLVLAFPYRRDRPKFLHSFLRCNSLSQISMKCMYICKYLCFFLTLAFVTEHFLASESIKQACILDITNKKKNLVLLSCYPVKAFMFQRREQMLETNYNNKLHPILCLLFSPPPPLSLHPGGRRFNCSVDVTMK